MAEAASAAAARFCHVMPNTCFSFYHYHIVIAKWIKLKDNQGIEKRKLYMFFMNIAITRKNIIRLSLQNAYITLNKIMAAASAETPAQGELYTII